MVFIPALLSTLISVLASSISTVKLQGTNVVMLDFVHVMVTWCVSTRRS